MSDNLFFGFQTVRRIITAYTMCAVGCSVYVPLETGLVHDGKALPKGETAYDIVYSRVATRCCSRHPIFPDRTNAHTFGVTAEDCDERLLTVAGRVGLGDHVEVGGTACSNFAAVGGEIFGKVSVTGNGAPFALAVVSSIGYAGGNSGQGSEGADESVESEVTASAMYLGLGTPVSWDVADGFTLKAEAELRQVFFAASAGYRLRDRQGTLTAQRRYADSFILPTYSLGFDIYGIGLALRLSRLHRPLWSVSVSSKLSSFLEKHSGSFTLP